jgi:hypothetical protein
VNDMRLDWILITKNLAQQLCSVGELDVLRRILDEAERDAACLSAPADFWDKVLIGYDKVRTTRDFAASGDAREMILARSRG